MQPSDEDEKILNFHDIYWDEVWEEYYKIVGEVYVTHGGMCDDIREVSMEEVNKILKESRNGINE